MRPNVSERVVRGTTKTPQSRQDSEKVTEVWKELQNLERCEQVDIRLIHGCKKKSQDGFETEQHGHPGLQLRSCRALRAVFMSINSEPGSICTN